MKFITGARKLTFSIILLSALISTGCGDSADSLLKLALKEMNSKIYSYSFEGTTTMSLGGIQDSGEIKYEGFYRAPKEIYMNLDMGIIDHSQSMEIYINEKEKVFTRISETGWQPYLAPPNLSNFQQPGQHQNAAQLLKVLDQVGVNPETIGEEIIDETKVTVIKLSADQSKLKKLISKQLTDNSRASADEKKILENTVKNMKINQDYLIYIDTETNRILKLSLKQTTELHMDQQNATIASDMVFYYKNFNQPVDMPVLEQDEE